MLDDTARTEAAVAACLENADELLRTARGAIDRDEVPRIGFHLAALALEELSKANLLGIVALAAKQGREIPDIIRNALEDRRHVKRLFWAIWTQTLGKDIVTAKQVEDIRGVARWIHETRLRGLYVDVSEGELSLPGSAVAKDAAVRLVDWGQALLDHERVRMTASIEVSNEVREQQAWFLNAGDDPECERFIFSKESMAKLAELGNPAKWVPWLKSTWERHQREARELLQRELERDTAQGDHTAMRWKFKIRLFTTTHSIRPKALAKWNKNVTWIKLETCNKRDQMLVEFSAPSGVHITDVYQSGWAMARRFAIALNVGSRGFFWWYVPHQTDSYFEKMTDLESRRDVRVSQPTQELSRKPVVLSENALDLTTVVMSLMPAFERDRNVMPLEKYTEAVTWLSKSDIHMRFESHAFGCFYGAFRAALQNWTGQAPEDSVLERVSAEFDRLAPNFDRKTEFIKSGEAFVSAGRLSPHTLPETMAMKALCDLLFWDVFKARQSDSPQL